MNSEIKLNQSSGSLFTNNEELEFLDFVIGFEKEHPNLQHIRDDYELERFVRKLLIFQRNCYNAPNTDVDERELKKL
jgi:hypothetical protein